MGFWHCNCIVVFDKNKEKLLFCKRAKNPYKGLLNFVGGKVEPEENSENAAYRELFEKTGISKRDIKLHRLMDMVIGLPSNIEQYEKRPDGIARKIVKPRNSTVFAVPTRQAVYEFTKDKQKDANLSAIGKGLSKQTIAIIPKMREVDEFLLSNEEYMNVIRESHPEVCFARLNGEILMTNKSEKEGIADRVQVLYMNKSQKWMDIIKRFSNTGETGRCPDCGYEEKLEVIITDDGIGSVTFHCKGCNRYTHFDGRRI